MITDLLGVTSEAEIEYIRKKEGYRKGNYENIKLNNNGDDRGNRTGDG